MSQKHTIKTIDKTFRFSGDKSSAVYGMDDSAYQTGISGLNISLAKDEVFYYNDIIDLKKLGSEKEVIQLFMTPSLNLGDKDVRRIIFQMQDASDPDNYVRVAAQAVDSDGGGNPWWVNTCYMTAAAPNQAYTGVEWGPPQKLHIGSLYEKSYTTQDYLQMRQTFIADCARLGVNNFTEWTALEQVFNIKI